MNNIVQKIEACLYGYTSPSKTVTLTMIYMYNKRSSAPNITRDILSYSIRSDHNTVKSETYINQNKNKKEVFKKERLKICIFSIKVYV